MPPVPCALCGYDAPGSACSACGRAPPSSAAASASPAPPHAPDAPVAPAALRERSLATELCGPLAGVLEGSVALFHGLRLLFTTRRIKRWLVPPLVLTCIALVLFFSWAFGELDRLLASAREARLELDPDWLARLAEHPWLHAPLAALLAALEWTLNAAWQLFASAPVRWLGWFLLGSLVVWYGFSILYEALSGPFLDEVHARVEARWFGMDPRARLAPARTRAATARAWLAHETRAAWSSLQASLVTGVLVLLALPLYFVPAVGYFLFALVCGFATSIGLLDIPFERRGWPLALRIRFVARHLPALVAFGIVAGLLLAIPLLGALLFVPASSLGGLWLLCRLDKRFLRR